MSAPHAAGTDEQTAFTPSAALRRRPLAALRWAPLLGAVLAGCATGSPGTTDAPAEESSPGAELDTEPRASGISEGPAASALAPPASPDAGDELFRSGFAPPTPGTQLILTFERGFVPARMEAVVNPEGTAPDAAFRVIEAIDGLPGLVVEVPRHAAPSLARLREARGLRFVDTNDVGSAGALTFAVRGSLPAKGAIDAAPGQPISFDFTEDVRLSSATLGSTIRVVRGTTPVSGGTLSLGCGKTTRLVYTPPAGQWQSGAAYTVTLTTGLKSTSGKSLTAGYTLTLKGVQADTSTFTSSALRQVRAPSAAYDGRGVKVAVLDTGYDYAHPDRPVGLQQGVNFVPSPATSDAQDDAGHGTRVIGVLAGGSNGRYGVAPAARVYPVKVLAPNACGNGYGLTADVIQGLYWARGDGNPSGRMDIVNMSLIDFPSDNRAFNQALSDAHAAGMLLIASAGNSGVSPVSWPAGHAKVVAVSAIDNNDRLAHFSNTGSDVELTAPGNFVYSTKPGGGYANATGTSFSAPIVAGVAALAKQARPTYTNVQLLQLLKDTADRTLGETYDRTKHGAGRVDASLTR